MKKKIVLIMLIILFIVGMILLNNVLQKETNKEIPKENVIQATEKQEEKKVTKVTSKNFKEEVLESEKTVLIDFYADWCGPCRVLSPRVEEFAKENEDIKVVKIDIDEEQDLAIEYDVMSIPTLVVIENGKEVDRAVGLLPKTKIEELVK